MRCKTCHYALNKLSDHRCPECGRAFDPNDPSTFRSEPKQRLNHEKMLMLAVACAPLLVWIVWLFVLIADGIRGGGEMFNTPRADFLGAVFLTIIYWPLILAAAIVLYVILVLFKVIHLRRAARR